MKSSLLRGFFLGHTHFVIANLQINLRQWPEVATVTNFAMNRQLIKFECWTIVGCLKALNLPLFPCVIQQTTNPGLDHIVLHQFWGLKTRTRIGAFLQNVSKIVTVLAWLCLDSRISGQSQKLLPHGFVIRTAFTSLKAVWETSFECKHPASEKQISNVSIQLRSAAGATPWFADISTGLNLFKFPAWIRESELHLHWHHYKQSERSQFREKPISTSRFGQHCICRMLLQSLPCSSRISATSEGKTRCRRRRRILPPVITTCFPAACKIQDNSASAGRGQASCSLPKASWTIKLLSSSAFRPPGPICL